MNNHDPEQGNPMANSGINRTDETVNSDDERKRDALVL